MTGQRYRESATFLQQYAMEKEAARNGSKLDPKGENAKMNLMAMLDQVRAYPTPHT